MTTSNADKKHLRRLGHNLKPVVTVAGKGLNENVSNEIERALSDHELIKIKLVADDRDAKKALTETICAEPCSSTDAVHRSHTADLPQGENAGPATV